MPGPITHLQAAYYYNVRQEKKYPAEIYLGSISPDSVNVGGFAPKEKRWPAHLRDADLKIWLKNAREFYADNKGKTDEAFLRGYIIHLVTDIAWDMYFNDKIYKSLLSVGVSRENLKDERWNELYGYEQLQVGTDWYNKVLEEFKSAKIIEIGTLNAEEIEILRDTVIFNRLQKGKQPKFIDKGLMSSLFEKVFEVAEQIFN